MTWSGKPVKTVRLLFERTICYFHSLGPSLFQLQQSYISTGHQTLRCLQDQVLKFSHTVVSVAEFTRIQQKEHILLFWYNNHYLEGFAFL